jgi:hypothetical protein
VRRASTESAGCFAEGAGLAADPTRAEKVHTTHDENRSKPEDRDNYRKDAAKESQEWTDVPGMGELPEQFDQKECAGGDGRSN